MRIVYVKQLAQMRLLKQAMALKHEFPDIELILYCKKVLINREIYNEIFEEIQQNITPEELEFIIKENETSNSKPDLYHVYCDVNNHYPYIVAKNTNIPLIYDANDLESLYCGIDKLNNIQRLREQIAMENASGICSKFPKSIYNYFINYGYDITAPITEYLDYCIPDFCIDRNLIPDAGTHLVYTGVTVSKDKPKSTHGNNQHYDNIKKIVGSGNIHFHLYASPWLGTPHEYHELSKQLNNFHVHEGLPQKELHQEIGKYHYGVSIHNFTGTTKLPDFEITSIGNKLSNYLEAGLPVIVSENLQWNSQIVTDLEVGFTVALSDLSKLHEIIDAQDIQKLRENVRRVRKEKWNAYSHAHRLKRFYDDILRNHIKDKDKGKRVIMDTNKTIPDLERELPSEIVKHVNDLETFATRPVKYSIIILTCNDYPNLVKMYNENLKRYLSDINNEIIMVDNGSTDETPAWLSGNNFPRQLHVLRFPNNIGNALAFSMAYRLTRGEYIFSLDSDIIIEGDWVHDAINILSKIHEIGFLGWEWGLKSGTQKNVEINGTLVRKTSGMAFGSKAFRRDLIEKIGYYDLHFNPYGLGDSDLGLRAMKAGYFNAYVPYKKSVHLGSDSGGRDFKDAALQKNKLHFHKKWRLEMMEETWDASGIIYSNPWTTK